VAGFFKTSAVSASAILNGIAQGVDSSCVKGCGANSCCKEGYMIHFGTFLVREGLATPEHIVQALDRQLEKQMAIGKIALEHRLLEMKHMFNILNRQVDTNLKFCDIAIALGYLTREQVDFILAIQMSKRPKIGEILVEMGVISPQQLEEALDGYAKLKASANSKTEALS
jgi:hypothetical protein